MRRELNAKIDLPEALAQTSSSHALGVNRWFKRRRISIAESYLMVISELESMQSRPRLEALRILMEASFHSKSLGMPLNTASSTRRASSVAVVRSGSDSIKASVPVSGR